MALGFPAITDPRSIPPQQKDILVAVQNIRARIQALEAAVTALQPLQKQVNGIASYVGYVPQSPLSNTQVTINTSSSITQTFPVTWEVNGTPIGTRSTVDFVAGSGIVITAADDPTNDRVVIILSLGGGGGNGCVPTSGGGGGTPTYSQTVLVDTPIAYWRLNDSGATAVDSSPSGFNQTIASGALVLQGNIVGANDVGGNSMLSSTNGIIPQFANAAFDLLSGWTVECWCRPTSTPGSFGLISDYYDGTNVYFSLSGDSGQPFAGLFNSGAWYRVYWSTALSNGTTYYIVGTYDGTTVRLYINGSLVGSTAAPAISASGTRKCSVGIRWDGNYFTGDIQAAAVYNFPLSASRIAAHYAAGP